MLLNDDNDIETQKIPLKRGRPYKKLNYGWERRKTSARAVLIKHPRIGMFFIFFWRKAKLILLRLKWKVIIFRGILKGTYCRDVDKEKIYWISPKKIEYICNTPFPLAELKGHVLGGNWDTLKERFIQLDVYIAFREVFFEGKKWQETIFYQRIIKRLNNGEILWSCKNKQDFDKRCKYLEHLYKSIKDDGYKNQVQLKDRHKNKLMIKQALKFNVWEQTHSDNEVSVSIGRNGDYLFCNGAHRLAIAKLLCIPRIPVRVAVRHTQWIKFRNELQMYATEIGGKTYQPTIHEDLDHIDCNHECADRLQVIQDNLSMEKGRLLDIGANLGFFCHKFEDAGFDCYAVEDSQINLNFLNCIKRAEHKKFKVIAASILESKDIFKEKFEITLALNIFHHFLKTKQTYDRFLGLLRNLKTKELFFESHLMEESQMKGAYKNYSPDEFVELILNNTDLNKAEFLSKASDGRSLYKLY